MFPTIRESAAVVSIILLLVFFLLQFFSDPGRGFRAPAFILSLAALTGYPSWGAAFALRPLRVARDLKRCDHDFPAAPGTRRTGQPTTSPPVLGAPASLIGSEFPRYWAHTLCGK